MNSMTVFQKNFLAILMCVGLGVGGGVTSLSAARQAAASPYSSSMEAVATYSATDFAVDGNLLKPAWEHAKWVKFDHDPTGKKENPSVATRVAAVWSDRYIYFAFSGRYDSLNVYEGEDISKE